MTSTTQHDGCARSVYSEYSEERAASATSLPRPSYSGAKPRRSRGTCTHVVQQTFWTIEQRCCPQAKWCVRDIIELPRTYVLHCIA